jgi:hypothetical protein
VGSVNEQWQFDQQPGEHFGWPAAVKYIPDVAIK